MGVEWNAELVGRALFCRAKCHKHGLTLPEPACVDVAPKKANAKTASVKAKSKSKPKPKPKAKATSTTTTLATVECSARPKRKTAGKTNGATKKKQRR